mgnify:CR=1 FL=1
MTGVIVGIGSVDSETARTIRGILEDLFPGVRFAVVPGNASVVFEFDPEVQS